MFGQSAPRMNDRDGEGVRGRGNVLVLAAGRRTSLVRAFVDATHERGGARRGRRRGWPGPGVRLRRRCRPEPPDGRSRLRRSHPGGGGSSRHRARRPDDRPRPSPPRCRACPLRRGGLSPGHLGSGVHRHHPGQAPDRPGLRLARRRRAAIVDPAAAAAAGLAGADVRQATGRQRQPGHIPGRSRRPRGHHRSRPRIPSSRRSSTGPEITIDALLDFEGRPIHYVPRRRIRTVGGESVEGVTLDHDPAFESWVERILRHCRISGLSDR